MSNCDYCSKTFSCLEGYKSGDGTIRKLDIIFIPKLRDFQVRILDSNDLSMCFGLDKRINYCPMCGEELSKDVV